MKGCFGCIGSIVFASVIYFCLYIHLSLIPDIQDYALQVVLQILMFFTVTLTVGIYAVIGLVGSLALLLEDEFDF